jgi:hypothetical protein
MIRRTIPELVAKYRLNPGVREVYVEGEFDRRVVRWYLNSKQLRDVAVIRIEMVDVPSAVLSRHALSDGAKSQVIGLGMELSTVCGAALTQATCVIDADNDRILDKPPWCNCVVPTDYTSMEMYLVRASLLAKYFQAVLGCEDLDVVDLLRQYSAILAELFLIRAANEAINLALRWISFASAYRNDRALREFDRDKFIRSLLQHSSAMGGRDQLLQEIEDLRHKLDGDIRNHSNGHDFLDLLWLDFGTRAKRCGLQNVEALSSALRGCIEEAQLDQEQMFVNLVGRVRAVKSA